mgnify:CR=1 FL=1
MNKKLEAVIDRFLLILREVANIITNIGVPVVAVIIIIVECIPGVPLVVLRVLKMVEEYMYQAFGTAQKIEERIEKKFPNTIPK